MKKGDPYSSIAPFPYLYSVVSKETIPNRHKQFPIVYKAAEIEQYEVRFFHRLMKKNFGPPSETQYEAPALNEGKEMAAGREWRYYFKTSSGGIIQVGTEDVHTCLKISHLLPRNVGKPTGRRLEEGKKFIDDLLREAQRLNQLFNIRNEFPDAPLSLVHNVYLINYRSAELMLEYSVEDEQRIRDEFLRYDARDPLSFEQQVHIDKFFPALGMYYAASISYFFMALEGLVNVLYFALLKDEIRDDFLGKGQTLFERLEIKTKILLMPSLCKGFKNNQKVGFFKALSQLTRYRNFLFHAKIQDSLKSAAFLEDNFLYRCSLEKCSQEAIPSLKNGLRRETVCEFKKVVDSMVKEILDMMQSESKHLVQKYVLDSLQIPFWRDETGVTKFGTLKSNITEENHNTH